jgi:signal recognition particle subunit SRP54
MFEALGDRLAAALKKITGRGVLRPEDVEAALREVRMALLEADVNFKVVRAFIDRVKTRALGQDVLRSLTPGQQVVKVVHDELVELFGDAHRLALAAHPPTVVMLIGLQGSGKTTTAAKLARYFVKQGQHPLLAAADVYRPAAIDQLRALGGQLGVPVAGQSGQTPIDICTAAVREAGERGLSPVILDTAGRLHIDEAMLDELRAIKAGVTPHHVLLVVDAMAGQDAVTVAEKFHAAVGVDAIILAKLDGDSRGGAALSVRHVTGRPIAFVGVGEKVDALEPFHPDRLASRLVGMGDVLSLVERAQETVAAEKAEELVRKIREEAFSLEDFREQLRQLRGMGPLDQLLGMLPFGKALRRAPTDLGDEQTDLRRFEAIIDSMTREERLSPPIINGSRRTRIARGSGTAVQDVNRLLKQYAQVKKMMRDLKGLEGKLKKGGLPGWRSISG